MELYYSFSTIIVIATLFAFINKLFLKLPSTIGIMVIAMIVSITLVFFVNPISGEPLNDLARLFQSFDFTDILMKGMLSFLLFAGAIHINLNDLKEQKTPVVVFSTLSVIISAFTIGFALYYLLNIMLPMLDLHLEMPYIYCLLFGALISPTDPIAVLSILKEAKVSKSLETKVAGESLFNDGIAVVVFAVILNLAEGKNVDLSFTHISWLFIKEAIGGLLVGLILGWIGSRMIKQAHDYKISVLITLSIVMGGSMISHLMHISGPLMMVAAGLIVGEVKRKRLENKVVDNNNLGTFWELIDEVMNAILFLFIGFELILIPHLERYWLIGCICIVVVLIARYISIKLPALIIPFKEKLTSGTIKILVWGGLRGGVSIALALSIPENPYKQVIIAATYFVVVFSIIIQGLTISKVTKKIAI
ncbi:sodium:proton antiporter [Dysgonomonas sp. Marseille-P4677]|uniref:cation:proton antiporter n=1 Tax=Dysgonomonas sp. Marseille-P4677 TaxID=2364790 RepID=UPI0019113175|nr:sodium:proton antiporter [Dysgonomonas sp. Marseille-P4677]MBK5722351.1 sodium:proton antiporter [Dysgonomonas sp. Marseille-P4677]